MERKHEIYTLQQYEELQKLQKIEGDSNNNVNVNINTNNHIVKGCQNNEILNVETKEDLPEIKLQEHQEIAEEKKEHKIDASFQQQQPQQKPLNIVKNTKYNLNENIINPNKIKREQTPPIAIATTPTNPTATTTTNQPTQPKPKPPINNNIIIDNTINIDKTSSSSIVVPIQSIQQSSIIHCPTTTVTRTIFEGNKVNLLPPSTTVTRTIFENKITDDKSGPKTVTSSILRPAAAALPFGPPNSLPTTTSTQSILQSQPLNVTPLGAAQSVTASVFAPRSQQLPLNTATAAILAKQPQQQSQQQQQQPVAANQQDMNKGYLTFAEDATELTSKYFIYIFNFYYFLNFY